MSYCHQCGARLRAGREFCGQCGAQSRTVAPEPDVAQDPVPIYEGATLPMAAQPHTPIRSRGVPVNTLPVLGISVVVAAALCGIFALVNHMRAPSYAAETTPVETPAEDVEPPSSEPAPVDVGEGEGVDPTPVEQSPLRSMRLVTMFDASTGTGRCFTRDTNSRAYVIINGRRRTSGFIQCGGSSPGMSAFGSFSFTSWEDSGIQEVVKVRATVLVDESGKRANATAVFSYKGVEFCTGSASWGRPNQVSCDLPPGANQVAGITVDIQPDDSSPGIWAGLVDPVVTVR